MMSGLSSKSGKQATKGQKQIYEENKSTIKFYSYMSAIAMAIYVLILLVFFNDQIFSFKYLAAFVFASSVYLCSLSLLKYMAKAVLSQSGSVVDGGTDLNMENGFAENFKDLIILTASVQTLSLISNYFWYCWLFAPGRAFYLLWVNILGPWFFAPAPQENEQVDEKKQRKMDRKMKRAAY